jgi:hypothetical protein
VLPPTGGFIGVVEDNPSLLMLAVGIFAAIASGVSLVAWASEDPRRRR